MLLTLPQKRRRMPMLPIPGCSFMGSTWSPGREKSEDAYVQRDPSGAPPDLRLSRLSNILASGETGDKLGLGVLLLPFILLTSTLHVCS